MGSTLTVVVLIAIGALLAGGAVVLAGVTFRRAAAGARARLDAIARGRTPVRRAGVRGLGVRSRGAVQVRPGTGALALFDDELVFVPLVGKSELRIPLDRITAATPARSFLGKRTGGNLLQVEWRATDDTTDAAAWQVPDLDGWLHALTK